MRNFFFNSILFLHKLPLTDTKSWELAIIVHIYSPWPLNLIDVVRALNSIFEQWNIKVNTDQWNISGEPCSGAAIDLTTPLNSGDYNPFIKCNCSYNNASLCHIDQLWVLFCILLVSMIHNELLYFVYLKYLKTNLKIWLWFT